MGVRAGAVVAVAPLSAAGCGTAPSPRGSDRPRCGSRVVTGSSAGEHVCLGVGGPVRVAPRGAGRDPVTATGPGLAEVPAGTFRPSAAGTVRPAAARTACPAPSAPGTVSCHARQAWTVPVDVRKPWTRTRAGCGGLPGPVCIRGRPSGDPRIRAGGLPGPAVAPVRYAVAGDPSHGCPARGTARARGEGGSRVAGVMVAAWPCSCSESVPPAASDSVSYCSSARRSVPRSRTSSPSGSSST